MSNDLRNLSIVDLSIHLSIHLSSSIDEGRLNQRIRPVVLAGEATDPGVGGDFGVQEMER